MPWRTVCFGEIHFARDQIVRTFSNDRLYQIDMIFDLERVRFESVTSFSFDTVPAAAAVDFIGRTGSKGEHSSAVAEPGQTQSNSVRALIFKRK